ncbi:unnamed protein product [Alopecurus aequalis]
MRPMAGRFLLTRDVSDLCIGKPPLRWLPPSSTVAEAITELDGSGPEAAVAVWDGHAKAAAGVAGRVCMPDVVLFLLGNLASPAAALQATLADLLAAAGADAPPIRRFEHHARSVTLARAPRNVSLSRTSTYVYDIVLTCRRDVHSLIQAVDALLGGTHSLVVPIRGTTNMCWLTVEDVVRFFLGSVALFSPTASRSVADLGVVRPATALSVAAGDDALSAVVPVLRAALATHASLAVVSGGRSLEGEISPWTLCSSIDVSLAAAAFAALSAGELASFVECGRAHQEAALRVVRSRLRRRKLLGMFDLLDGGRDVVDPPSPSCSSSSSLWTSSSASSCSSEDEEEEEHVTSAYTSTRQGTSSGRWAKGTRPAAGQPIACRRGSSLVAVMAQAVAHRVTQVWVLDDENQELVGVVGFLDVLRVLRHHLLASPPAPL